MTISQLLLTVSLTILGSSGIATVIVTLLQHHWAKKETKDARIDALVEAQQVMMIDRVRFLGKSYIQEKTITLADKENLVSMYKAYKNLGGNGHLETVMHEVEQLEVI